MKKIKLNTCIYDLVKKYPELKGILFEIGFIDILKPGIIESMGRFITIEKGVEAKGFDIETVIELLEERGYSIEK